MQRVLFALAVAGLAAAPSASTPDPARTFLTSAFGLSGADIARVDRGEIVARTLEVKNGREIATLGVVRIRTSPESYVEHLRDIATFKRTDDILQIGTFSAPPREGDLAALIIEEADLNRFRQCRVGECGVRLSAEGIERVRREIDWRAADANPKTSRLLRTLLVEYVADYREGGTAAAMEYAGTSAPLNVGREFAALVDADTSTWTYVPRLRRQLLEYPAGADDPSSGFIYWSKERVHHRPVVSITHVVVVRGEKPSPVTYAIGTKQIYATHYFDASLGVTLLLRDITAPSPATFVVYLNRSRIDIFDGLFGGVARRIVAGRARSLVAEQLARIQRSLTADVTPTASGSRESAAR
ncbi:MAG TPA: hypothetical protein VGQ37_18450 [Vicinamibacterales bacterium]|nr:hypothetical protein [Vicinamibacterales bacterium]